MGLFTSRKQRQELEAREAEAVAARTNADAAAQARRNREDAWRRDRHDVLQRLHRARRAHGQAKTLYDRYAPGPQKNAAAAQLNAAADHLASLEREFAAVDSFSTWSKSH
ncbi:hypothetical protein AB0B89_29210 [Sphaerisporangium sp. NPDC049002]|uniref:hypothetical protein n=1 Tax=Sphaerisporangium sp. NPDC049002 TaxID=3155392 RepID=UPI0033E2B167